MYRRMSLLLIAAGFGLLPAVPAAQGQGARGVSCDAHQIHGLERLRAVGDPLARGGDVQLVYPPFHPRGEEGAVTLVKGDLAGRPDILGQLPLGHRGRQDPA